MLVINNIAPKTLFFSKPYLQQRIAPKYGGVGNETSAHGVQEPPAWDPWLIHMGGSCCEETLRSRKEPWMGDSGKASRAEILT